MPTTSAASTSARPLRAAVFLGMLAGTVGATFGGWLVLELIKRSRSACAIAGGFLAMPGVAARFAAPAAAFGAALGLLLSGLRAGRRLRRPDLLLSLLSVLLLGGWGAALVVPRVVVRPEVRKVSQLSEPELGQRLERRWFGHNVYVLAAIASNPRASPQTLARIAQRPEPQLHVTPGNSLLDVLVSPSREFDDSVMVLLAKNPQTPPESLERLATSRDGYVLAAVAHNPKLSATTLARLSESSTTAVRCAVASNPGTPPEVRERLQNDPVPFVRDAALHTIRAEQTNTPLLVR